MGEGKGVEMIETLQAKTIWTQLHKSKNTNKVKDIAGEKQVGDENFSFKIYKKILKIKPYLAWLNNCPFMLFVILWYWLTWQDFVLYLL